MDVGLATSGQIQAYHDEDAKQGKRLRPRFTWWMSATLQPEWLRTIDTEEQYEGWVDRPITVPRAERAFGPGSARKSCSIEEIPAVEARAFAERVARAHGELIDGEYGRITLVVCNTVDRACQTFDALKKSKISAALELVHSRFRPAERAAWRQGFLERAACKRGVDRIIVATQVVEAGVDISAGCLITELAPWPSLVQRFGRCARYGGDGTVIVVDRCLKDKAALPYDAEQLEAARAALAELSEVGIASLEAFEEKLPGAQRKELYPYAPTHLLLRREFDELFDTTPDLTGAQLDIGRFIRSSDERDIQVCWLEVPLRDPRMSKTPSEPPPRYHPRRDELCSVPFLLARDWLCGKAARTRPMAKLRAGMRAWVWDWIDGRWVVVKRDAILPGRIVAVASDCGGYDPQRGFEPQASAAVAVVPAPSLPADVEREAQADDAEDHEDLSVAAWKTLACHGRETAELAREIARRLDLGKIAERLGLRERLPEILALAALWHDLGKAHPVFQGSIRDGDRPQRQDLAKAPDGAWLRPPGTYRTADGTDERKGFRHELASALSLFAVLERHAPDHPALLGPWRGALDLAGIRTVAPVQFGEPRTPIERRILECSAEEFDLLAYLVICHHGKVRVALHASPKDQEYRVRDERGLPIRGVREGDELPAVALDSDPDAPSLPPFSLTLEPATLGLSGRTGRSWRERTLELQARYGPGGLAWLEALIIAADRRASRLRTPDPALVPDEVAR